MGYVQVIEDQLCGSWILAQGQRPEVRTLGKIQNHVLNPDIEFFDMMTVARHGFKFRSLSGEVDILPD
jgi:hypothetical protein